MAVTVRATSGLTQAASPLSLITGSAPQNKLAELIGYLESIRSSRNVTIVVNTTTGLCGAEGITESDVIARLRAGQVWVDYGNWPFGMCGQSILRNYFGSQPNYGFTSFLLGAFRGGYGPISPPDTRFFSPGIGIKSLTGFEFYAGGNDRFDFFINPGSRTSDWSFATNMIRGSGPPNAYPYAFGLPTSATRSGFVDMPGAPIARVGAVYGRTVNQIITIHSAFAMRVGNSWYFEAQPEIDPGAYAKFIARVLGLPEPSTPTTVTPSCDVPVTQKPTLVEGDQGDWVKLLQERLNAWGAHLTVDGVFGPLTLAALKSLQSRHNGQYYGGYEVKVTGATGPGTWNMLCSPPGTQGTGPPTGGTTTSSTLSPCNSYLVQQTQRILNLPTCADAELVLAAGGATLLILLMRLMSF